MAFASACNELQIKTSYERQSESAANWMTGLVFCYKCKMFLVEDFKKACCAFRIYDDDDEYEGIDDQTKQIGYNWWYDELGLTYLAVKKPSSCTAVKNLGAAKERSLVSVEDPECHLFQKLPLEVRRMIWKLVVAVTDPIDVLWRKKCDHIDLFEFRLCEYDDPDKCHGRSNSYEDVHEDRDNWEKQENEWSYDCGSLLMVSRAVAQEVLPVIFEVNEIHLDDDPEFTPSKDTFPNVIRGGIMEFFNAFKPFCPLIKDLQIQTLVSTVVDERYTKHYGKIIKAYETSGWFSDWATTPHHPEWYAGSILRNPSFAQVFSGLKHISINLFADKWTEPGCHTGCHSKREWLYLFRQLAKLDLASARVDILPFVLRGESLGPQNVSYEEVEYLPGEKPSSAYHLEHTLHLRGRWVSRMYYDLLEKDAMKIIRGEGPADEEPDESNVYESSEHESDVEEDDEDEDE